MGVTYFIGGMDKYWEWCSKKLAFGIGLIIIPRTFYRTKFTFLQTYYGYLNIRTSLKAVFMAIKQFQDLVKCSKSRTVKLPF